jgi:hypothetical protein
LWFTALSSFETEYYLLHFIYKLFNNDNVAKMIIQNDPFNGTAPRFIKIDLDHYPFH